MQGLDESLSEMNKLENNDEILMNLGKRIFVPVNLRDKKLIVDVGNKKLVKKSISETRGIIEEQLKRLIAAKTDIMERLQDLEANMGQIIQNLNKEPKEHEHECTCEDGNCDCEDDECKCDK
jgi:prefoldin alpha subunit